MRRRRENGEGDGNGVTDLFNTHRDQQRQEQLGSGRSRGSSVMMMKKQEDIQAEVR